MTDAVGNPDSETIHTESLPSEHPEVTVDLDYHPVHEGGPIVPVAIVTLRRDHKRNALDAGVCAAVAAAVTTAEEHGARCILVRGEGKAFCAGADLAGGVYTSEFHENLQKMLTTIMDSPLPVVADIQGPAVGAGTQLAMACDLRVVGDHGWFRVPVVRLGIAVDSWTVTRCAQLVGGARARSFLLTAEKMDQAAALTCGMASAPGDADDALDYARTLAGHAPMTLHHLKMVLNRPVEPASAEEEELRRKCWASNDAAEARVARKEKRDPVFRGE